MNDTLKKLAQQALDVQDACNPRAVAHEYGRALSELHDGLTEANLPTDTEAICRHPINRLWADKIYSLAGLPSNLGHYGPAYKACQKLARGEAL